MKTIHIIMNAHLDPIWLWPWQAGLDEALATCRSACDRLDAHPDVIFTRGEAWVYEQIEKLDPALFKRILNHVANGQWEIVGGWYIQPDCNLPSYWGMEKQISLGKSFFEDRFGQFPKTAYNVDSFGHAAALPGLMHDAGQNSYIMMRPHEPEKPIPARLFRWRGYESGPEIVTYRLETYITNSEQELTMEYLAKVVTKIPDGIDHALCFVGIGDHGGGPTEQQIAWCREHKNALPEWQLEFSSPSRFFNAVAPHKDKLPLITGDLQHNAPGCYTVVRSVKTGVRRGEHMLKQAEIIGKGYMGEGDEAAIEKEWKHVCFHQFHDTLGGTAIPSAYVQITAQLGSAASQADEVMQYALRRRISELPDNPLQRIVLFNASDMVHDGYVEFEPWVDWWQPWTKDCRLIDETGELVPFQVIESEAHANFFSDNGHFSRLLFPLQMEPGKMRVLRIQRGQDRIEFPWAMSIERNNRIANTLGVSCSMDDMQWKDVPFKIAPRLELIRDPSDTWGHDFYAYDENPQDIAKWSDAIVLDRNPLMASMYSFGSIGASTLRGEWRVYANEPYVEFLLRVPWQEKKRVLKLTLPFKGDEVRTDGVMGTSLVRENTGNEDPIRDWTRLTSGNDSLSVVCPDIYGADATPERLRLTLLRSPLMSDHIPFSKPVHRGIYADQGVHEFRFRFFAGAPLPDEYLDQQGFMMQRPPVIADLTRGMPADFRTVHRSE